MRFSGPSTAPPCAVTRSIDAVGLFLEGLPIAEIFDVVWIETSAELQAIHVVDGVLHASEILECRLAPDMNAVAPHGIRVEIRYLPICRLAHDAWEAGLRAVPKDTSPPSSTIYRLAATSVTVVTPPAMLRPTCPSTEMGCSENARPVPPVSTFAPSPTPSVASAPAPA